jgi:hypothetical protein
MQMLDRLDETIDRFFLAAGFHCRFSARAGQDMVARSATTVKNLMLPAAVAAR